MRRFGGGGTSEDDEDEGTTSSATSTDGPDRRRESLRDRLGGRTSRSTSDSNQQQTTSEETETTRDETASDSVGADLAEDSTEPQSQQAVEDRRIDVQQGAQAAAKQTQRSEAERATAERVRDRTESTVDTRDRVDDATQRQDAIGRQARDLRERVLEQTNVDPGNVEGARASDLVRVERDGDTLQTQLTDRGRRAVTRQQVVEDRGYAPDEFELQERGEGFVVETTDTYDRRLRQEINEAPGADVRDPTEQEESIPDAAFSMRRLETAGGDVSAPEDAGPDRDATIEIAPRPTAADQKQVPDSEDQPPITDLDADQRRQLAAGDTDEATQSGESDRIEASDVRTAALSTVAPALAGVQAAREFHDPGRVGSEARAGDVGVMDLLRDPSGSVDAIQSGDEFIDSRFHVSRSGAESGVRSTSQSAVSVAAGPFNEAIEGTTATRFSVGGSAGRRPSGGPVAAPGPLGGTGTVRAAGTVRQLLARSKPGLSGASRTGPTGSVDVAESVARQGQFASDAVERVVAGTSAAALVQSEIETPKETGLSSESELETPEDSSATRGELDQPEDPSPTQAELEVGETVGQSEIETPDDPRPGTSEIDVTEDPTARAAGLAGQIEQVDEEDDLRDEATRESVIVPEEFVPEETVVIGDVESDLSEEDVSDPEVTEEFDRTREFPTGDESVVSQEVAQEELARAEEAASSEVTPETEQLSGVRQRLEQSQETLTAGESLVGVSPLGAARERTRAMAREDLQTGMGPLAFTETTGVQGTYLGSRVGVATASEVAIGNEFETETEPINETVTAQMNMGGPGLDGGGNRPPRWGGDFDAIDSGSSGRSSGTGRETDSPLTPGWLEETVTTIAVGGMEPARSPSQSDLEEQPMGAQLTGGLPTAQMLSGDEETRERIEEVESLLGGFQFDDEGGGIL